MYSGKLRLTNSSQTPLALSSEFRNEYSFSAAVTECNSAQELLNVTADYLKNDYFLTICVDTSLYTKLSFKDANGAIRYLYADKDEDFNELTNFSDDELITELERRGYSIV